MTTRLNELLMQAFTTQQLETEKTKNFSLSYSNSTHESDDNLFKSSRLTSYVLLTISSVCIVLTLYLFLCVLLFIKRKSLHKMEKRDQSMSKLNVSNNGPVLSPVNALLNEKEFNSNTGTPTEVVRTTRIKHLVKPIEKNSFQAAQIMHYVLLCTLGLNLLRGLFEQLLFYVGNTSDQWCSLMTKLIIGVTGFVIHGCFVFLWLRQYVFYTNPLLRNTRPKILKWISYATYVEMVATVLICMVIHVWWRDYTSIDGACAPIMGSRKVSPAVPYGILVVSTVTIQISLTFLFVYPIVNHRKQMNVHRNKRSIRSETLCKISRSADRLLECVKRALVAATVAVTTDVVGSFVGIWTADAMPVFLFSVLYELDVLLNILCLFYTYVYWRDIVFPWRTKKQCITEKATDSKIKNTLLS